MNKGKIKCTICDKKLCEDTENKDKWKVRTKHYIDEISKEEFCDVRYYCGKCTPTLIGEA